MTEMHDCTLADNSAQWSLIMITTKIGSNFRTAWNKTYKSCNRNRIFCSRRRINLSISTIPFKQVERSSSRVGVSSTKSWTRSNRLLISTGDNRGWQSQRRRRRSPIPAVIVWLSRPKRLLIKQGRRIPWGVIFWLASGQDIQSRESRAV